MDILKKAGKVLFFPHLAIMISLIPISAVLLVLAFSLDPEIPPLSYTSYGISAYTLTVWCFRIPKIIKFFKKISIEHPLIVKYRSDVAFRIKLTLNFSLVYNLAYAALQLGLGIYHRSVWFYSLAAYYFLLFAIRLFLLRAVRPKNQAERKGQWKKYRLCGILLGIMTLALIIVVIYITYKVRGFRHHEITTIALAAYTFTAFTTAIVNLIRYKKYESPVFSAAKITSLVAAMVSMMTLENAMLNAFGGDTAPETYAIFTGLTGIAVCVTVLVFAVFMIVKASNELKKADEG